MTTFLPKYFTKKAIQLYVILLAICSLALLNRMLPLHWMAFGLLEVIGFFYFANSLTKKWSHIPLFIFEKKILRTALIIRIVYVLFSYLFYYWMTGQPYEFSAADSMGYDNEARWLLDLIPLNQQDVYLSYIKGNYSDMGYVSYLALIYALFWKSILFVRLLKALLSAYTCVLIYRLAERNFGEATAKIAGILAMIFPNLIYYCGLHLKETEMVFLTVLFIERADFIIRQVKINFILYIITILIGLSLFLFRTVLGVTATLSLVTGFLFLSSKKHGIQKKINFSILLLLFITFLSGGNLEKEVIGYWGAKDSNQKVSMEARSNSNSLASYGTTAVFAPAILLVPFPTLTNISTQQNQMMMNGSYFIKNIFGFFVILGIILTYRLKKIANCSLLLSFITSYLAVIAMSKFAISERFHLPALPFLIIIGAFGVTQLTVQNKKYYNVYLLVIATAIIGWNFFKLAGRGSI